MIEVRKGILNGIRKFVQTKVDINAPLSDFLIAFCTVKRPISRIFFFLRTTLYCTVFAHTRMGGVQSPLKF